MRFCCSDAVLGEDGFLPRLGTPCRFTPKGRGAPGLVQSEDILPCGAASFLGARAAAEPSRLRGKASSSGGGRPSAAPLHLCRPGPTGLGGPGTQTLGEGWNGETPPPYPRPSGLGAHPIQPATVLALGAEPSGARGGRFKPARDPRGAWWGVRCQTPGGPVLRPSAAAAAGPEGRLRESKSKPQGVRSFGMSAVAPARSGGVQGQAPAVLVLRRRPRGLGETEGKPQGVLRVSPSPPCPRGPVGGSNGKPQGGWSFRPPPPPRGAWGVREEVLGGPALRPFAAAPAVLGGSGARGQVPGAALRRRSGPGLRRGPAALELPRRGPPPQTPARRPSPPGPSPASASGRGEQEWARAAAGSTSTAAAAAASREGPEERARAEAFQWARQREGCRRRA